MASLALVLLSAFALAGCGSGGSHSSSADTAGAATSAARFVSSARGICAKLVTQEQPLRAREKTLDELPPSARNTAYVSIATSIVKLSRAAYGKLHALPRPGADAEAIESLLTAYGNEVTDVSYMAGAVAHQENSNGEAAAASLKRSIASNKRAAERFGVIGCMGAE